jgi:hypothetical protein
MRRMIEHMLVLGHEDMRSTRDVFLDEWDGSEMRVSSMVWSFAALQEGFDTLLIWFLHVFCVNKSCQVLISLFFLQCTI